jgi:hypothetical protein
VPPLAPWQKLIAQWGPLAQRLRPWQAEPALEAAGRALDHRPTAFPEYGEPSSADLGCIDVLEHIEPFLANVLTNWPRSTTRGFY